MDVGFAEIVSPGKFETNAYRLLSHKEWLAKHPGQCAVKETFPWTGEDDKLGQNLWNASGGRLQCKRHQVKMLRSMGLDDRQIVTEFKRFLQMEKTRSGGGRTRRSSTGIPVKFLWWLKQRVEKGDIPSADSRERAPVDK